MANEKKFEKLKEKFENEFSKNLDDSFKDFITLGGKYIIDEEYPTFTTLNKTNGKSYIIAHNDLKEFERKLNKKIKEFKNLEYYVNFNNYNYKINKINQRNHHFSLILIVDVVSKLNSKYKKLFEHYGFELDEDKLEKLAKFSKEIYNQLFVYSYISIDELYKTKEKLLNTMRGFEKIIPDWREKSLRIDIPNYYTVIEVKEEK